MTIQETDCRRKKKALYLSTFKGFILLFERGTLNSFCTKFHKLCSWSYTLLLPHFPDMEIKFCAASDVTQGKLFKLSEPRLLITMCNSFFFKERKEFGIYLFRVLLGQLEATSKDVTAEICVYICICIYIHKYFKFFL